MMKRIIGLVVASSLISAALLFLGTTVMGKFSPVLASSGNSLAVGTKVPASSDSISTGQKVPLKTRLGSETIKTAALSSVIAGSASPTTPSQPLVTSVPTASVALPKTGITIAQLLNSPDQYIHKLFTITGIATHLSEEKFLLNDGTGQILVEVDDDLIKYSVLNGLSITVTGEFDDDSSRNGYELDACTITDKNGTRIVDDCLCLDDDCAGDDCTDDDCDDAIDDDCNDDTDDDIDDDDDGED
jgi:uncharacterized protein YdeI (BOF family)